MKKFLSALAVTTTCLAALPALAGAAPNTLISYDGLGVGGDAQINPGTFAPDGSGLISLNAGTGASDVGYLTFHIGLHDNRAGSEAPPNCVFGPAADFENGGHWGFPSMFTQYGKDPATGNVTVEWRTGHPLIAGQTYLIVRVCGMKSKNPN